MAPELTPVADGTASQRDEEPRAPLPSRWPRAFRLGLFFSFAFAFTLLCTAYGRIVCWAGLFPFRRARRNATSRLNRFWNRTLLHVADALALIRVEVEGSVPSPRPLLVVSNHQSLLDIPILHLALGDNHLIRYVVKKELKWGVPVLSPSCRVAGYAFVDRRPQANLANIAALTLFARRLVGDGVLAGVLFPEGTWEPRGRPLPFKSAGLRTLLRAVQVDVLPVVIDGTWRAQRFTDLPRMLGSLRVHVKVGEIIPAAEAAADSEALAERLEREIHAALTGA